MYAYLISHNGLGDNLFMVGALRFLLSYYNAIYFICKRQNYANVVLFFSDEPRIVCVPIDETDESREIANVVRDKYENPDCDVLVCGQFHKSYLRSKITNPRFLEYNSLKSDYTIEYDTITNDTYSFIESFYQDIGLNLTHFYDYFVLPQMSESRTLYEKIRKYYIVFIQSKCSDGRQLNITELVTKYAHDDKTLLISNDQNLYDPTRQPVKYELCQPFVHNKLVNYVDTIKNSDEIYIIDSCFVGIVLPYLKAGDLKAGDLKAGDLKAGDLKAGDLKAGDLKVRIIRRDLV
jgi:hypothetical protein